MKPNAFIFTEEMMNIVIPRLVPGKDVSVMKEHGIIAEEYLDMGITYLVLQKDKYIVLCQSHITGLRITERDIFESAVRNIEKTAEIKLIETVLSEMMDTPMSPSLPGSGLYVVSRKEVDFGAAAILSPKVRKKVLETLDGPVMVIPSSVHEMLAFSYCEDNVEEVIKTIRDVNRTEISRQEYLSDSLYAIRKNKLEIFYPGK